MNAGAAIARLELRVRRLSRSRELWSGVMGLDEVAGPDEQGSGVAGHLRHHDDERGHLMTYVTAGATVVEPFSLDVAVTGFDRLV